MPTVNDIVLKAYDIYGSSLGIKSVVLPKANKPNLFLRISDFYFFLKDEPLPAKTWEEQDKLKNAGKISHCVPFRGGFYCYTNGKQYKTLADWYCDNGRPLYGKSLPPLEEVLLYGRRNQNGLAYELTYTQLLEKLNTLLSGKLYEQEANSWDTLVKMLPRGIGRNGLKLYYKDPELNAILKTAILKNQSPDWTPEMPRYVVPIRNKYGDGQQPIFRYTNSVDEVHPSLSLDNIFIETHKIFDEYKLSQTVLVPLMELLPKES